MDPPLGLGLRDPLDAVGAALVLEDRVGAVALDRERHLLEATDLGSALGEDLGAEAALLGVAGEHLVEIAGEQGRLVAPGPGTDLDEDVLVVVGVALDHRQADLLGELLEPGRGLGDDPAQLLVLVVGEQLAGTFEIVVERPPLARQPRRRPRARCTRARPRRSAPGRRSRRDPTSRARGRRSRSSIWLTSCSIIEPESDGTSTWSSSLGVAMLDLQGRVVDLEPLVDLVLEREPFAVAVGLGVDQHVGGKRREARGDLPDVQVVDLDHARHRDHRVADLVRVESAGSRLEEDAARLPEQAVGGVEHDRGDDQRGDPVGLVEAGRQDDEPGDRGEDEGGEVGEEVLEGSLDVERFAVRLRERPGRDQVDGDPEDRHGEDDAALDRRRVDQPPDALVRRSAARARAGSRR